MTRLCALTTSYPRWVGDDAGIFVERLLGALAAEFDEVVVVVPADTTEPLRESRGGVTIGRYRYGIFAPGRLAFGLGISPNLRARPTLLLQIPGLLLGMVWCARRELRTGDVVLANWLSAGFVAWLLKRIGGNRYVVVLRGGDIKILRRFPRFCGSVLRDAQRVVVVSESLRDEVTALLPELTEAVEVIPNGITVSKPTAGELDRFLTTRGLRKGRYLLFVGSCIPRKRIDHLLQIVAAGSLIDLDLVVCGREEANYRAQLLEQARNLGIAERVRFEGLVPPEDVSLYLAGAAAYISASEFEGRPNGVLEAMLAGIPCIASDIPAHRELIVDEESGLLFSYDVPLQTAQRVRDLIGEPARCREIAERAAARIAESSWERCAERYRATFS